MITLLLAFEAHLFVSNCARTISTNDHVAAFIDHSRERFQRIKSFRLSFRDTRQFQVGSVSHDSGKQAVPSETTTVTRTREFIVDGEKFRMTKFAGGGLHVGDRREFGINEFVVTYSGERMKHMAVHGAGTFHGGSVWAHFEESIISAFVSNDSTGLIWHYAVRPFGGRDSQIKLHAHAYETVPERYSFEGKACVVLRTPVDGTSMTKLVTVCPERDYSIVCLQVFNRDGKEQFSAIVGKQVKLHEIWIPARVNYAEHHGDQLIHTGVMELESLKVNPVEPIPASAFDVEFIPGTVVTDDVQGALFVVEKDGTMTRFANNQSAQANAHAAEILGRAWKLKLDDSERSSAVSEPFIASTTLLLVCASLVVGVIACMIVWRRLRR